MGLRIFSPCEFTLTVLVTSQSRAMHHISKAFTVACSKLEKIGNGMIPAPYLLFALFFFLTVSHMIDG
jgi:hypothetical protein